MKLRLEDKKRAIELRVRGKSYGEIMATVPNLPKSTLSTWLKNVTLTPEQEEKLRKNIEKITCDARVKAGWTKRQQKQQRIKELFKEAQKEYLSLVKNPLFRVGVILYWAEGGRKTEMFQFTNSDPRAVRAMMRWLREICKIPEEKIRFRVFIHKIYAHENCEEFWSKITGIPVSNFQKTIYKPTPHKLKKNPEYKGCIQIRVFKTDFFWKVIGWVEALIKEFKFE